MVDLPWLDPNQVAFPPVTQALREPNGLLAAGGRLDSETLLAAYQQGIFPWFDEQDPVLWWAPDPRAVLFPDKIKISRSLQKIIKKGQYRITFDVDFEQVIAQCAQTPRKGQAGTWLHPEMITAYIQLHHQQVAHSVEVWDDQQQLVGGLYGLAIGCAFFGESMFSHVPNASKLALVYLCKQLALWHFGFVDCQVESDHLTSLGAETIPRTAFTSLLAQYCQMQGPSEWHLDWHG